MQSDAIASPPPIGRPAPGTAQLAQPFAYECDGPGSRPRLRTRGPAPPPPAMRCDAQSGAERCCAAEGAARSQVGPGRGRRGAESAGGKGDAARGGRALRGTGHRAPPAGPHSARGGLSRGPGGPFAHRPTCRGLRGTPPRPRPAGVGVGPHGSEGTGAGSPRCGAERRWEGGEGPGIPGGTGRREGGTDARSMK